MPWPKAIVVKTQRESWGTVAQLRTFGGHLRWSLDICIVMACFDAASVMTHGEQFILDVISRQRRPCGLQHFVDPQISLTRILFSLDFVHSFRVISEISCLYRFMMLIADALWSMVQRGSNVPPVWQFLILAAPLLLVEASLEHHSLSGLHRHERLQKQKERGLAPLECQLHCLTCSCTYKHTRHERSRQTRCLWTVTNVAAALFRPYPGL